MPDGEAILPRAGLAADSVVKESLTTANGQAPKATVKEYLTVQIENGRHSPAFPTIDREKTDAYLKGFGIDG